MAAPIEAWFSQWLREHLGRHALLRLPDFSSDQGRAFFDGWRFKFQRKDVDQETATEASIRLVGENVYKSKHFNRLLELVQEIRLERGVNPGAADSSTRESALEGSKNCPHCGGQGIASVRWFNPQPWHAEGTCAAYCLCPMGHWIRRQHKHGARDVYKRLPLMADVLAGRHPQFEVFSVGSEVC